MNRVQNIFYWFWKKDLKVKLAALAVILFVGWVLYTKLGSARTAATQYQTATVTRGTIVSSVSESGQMATANRLPITTQGSGQIKQIFVKNGDTVSAGQNILELSLDQTGQQRTASAWSAVLAAQNNLASAQTQLWTLQNQEFVANQKFMNDAVERDLSTSDPIYIEENATWLAAEASYKNQANVIGQAQAALSNAWLNYQGSSPIVTAPGSGVVADLVLTPGMAITSQTNSSNVPSATTVGDIVTNNAPTATFNLSEVDVTKVKEGQKATLTLDALPGMTYTGTVTGINRSGLVTSNVTNYPAVIQFDTSPDNVLPNMSVNANIIVQTKDNVLLVPTAAIQTRNGQSTVRILKNGQVQTVAVETGLASDTQTEITSGLSEGDTVIIGGLTTPASQSASSPFGAFRFGGGGGAVFRRGGGG